MSSSFRHLAAGVTIVMAAVIVTAAVAGAAAGAAARQPVWAKLFPKPPRGWAWEMGQPPSVQWRYSGHALHLSLTAETPGCPSGNGRRVDYEGRAGKVELTVVRYGTSAAATKDLSGDCFTGMGNSGAWRAASLPGGEIYYTDCNGQEPCGYSGVFRVNSYAVWVNGVNWGNTVGQMRSWVRLELALVHKYG